MSERTSRRSFLKTAIAAPLAVTLPAQATAAVLPMASPPAPLPAHPWRWWFTCGGQYDEVFTEEFDTKEAALEFLTREGEGFIAECQRQNFDLRLDGDAVFEALLGQNEDIIGQGEFLDSATAEQVRDLGVMVSAAIKDWVQKHKIDTSAWVFGGVRNQIKFDEIVKHCKTNAENPNDSKTTRK